MNRILTFIFWIIFLLFILDSSCTYNNNLEYQDEEHESKNNLDSIFFNKKSVKLYNAKLPDGKRIYLIIQPEKDKTLGSMRIENAAGDLERNDLIRGETDKNHDTLFVLRSLEDSIVLFKGKFSGDSLNGTLLNEEVNFVYKKLPYSLYIKKRQRTASGNNALSPILNYPYFESGRYKVFQEKFNHLFEGYVMRLISDSKMFKNDSLGSNLELTQSVNVTYLSKSVLSFEIFSYAYFQNSAHGSERLEGSTFNIQTGDSIIFESLFNVESKYLDFLSSYCKKKLEYNLSKGNTGGSLLKFEIAPIAENFKYFYLTNNSIVILFLPYQLGPYATEALKVEIPYNLLIKYLKDDCVIQTILKEENRI